MRLSKGGINMHLVFNELSQLDILDNKADGCRIFEDFLKTYSKAVSSDIGFARGIITTFDLNNIEISSGYYAAEWRNSKGIDRDLQTRYKRLCDLQELRTYSDSDSELTYKGKVSVGLHIAYQEDLTAISIRNSSYWNDYYLKCEYYVLDLDETFQVNLRNICSSQTIDDNIDDILDRKQAYANSCSTSQEMLDKLDELFPSLVFHKVAIDQIKNQIEKQHIPIIIRKLQQLESYFSDWNGEFFDQSSFPNRNVSPQSVETLKRFKDDHTFVFDDEKIIVSYHMRYSGNIPGRIYFYPDKKIKKARICSLTTKLPTVTNPKSKI